MTEHEEEKCLLHDTDCDVAVRRWKCLQNREELLSHLEKLKILPANIAKSIVENTAPILVTIHQQILPVLPCSD